MCLLKGGDRGLYPPIMTGEIVVDGAVFAVCHHGGYAVGGVCLMPVDGLLEYFPIIHRAGGNCCGGNDFMFVINRPVCLIPKL